MHNTRHRIGDKGQALVEFALIAIVLFMLLFILVEVSRVLWGWVTVQSAARAGARYAITGRDDCEPDATRVECVLKAAENELEGLPLNRDPGARYEDDNYFLIQVFGVDDIGQLIENFAGSPGQPVVVRVTYRVPIVTPLVRPIRESIVVYGQVTMNNELFSSLGGSSAGAGLPPPLPELPTAGPTATPTATATAGASPTGTATATSTATATEPPCRTQFVGQMVHGDTSVRVSGEGHAAGGPDVTLYDTSVTTTPGVFRTIGQGELLFDGSGQYPCEDFRQVPVSPPLIGNHVILVVNENQGDASSDVGIVVPEPPTATPTPTNTVAPTRTPTPSRTPSPTPTPPGPRLLVRPTCGFGPSVQFAVEGLHWMDGSQPYSQINLYWERPGQSPALQAIVSGPAFVAQNWTFNNITDGTYYVHARTHNLNRTVAFTVPCPNQAPPTAVATATATPRPADLIISGPQLISTPPIVEYRPITMRFVITNTGSVDINTQFFTDAYFDPPQSEITETGIDVSFSDGYLGLGSIPAESTRIVDITAPLGFQGGVIGTRTIYGMVDSLEQVFEASEVNNLTGPLNVRVTPAAVTPTPSPTPGGSQSISGRVYANISNWAPQRRASVWLIDRSTGNVLHGPVTTDADGRYSFNNISPVAYDIYACFRLENAWYVGNRPMITPPNLYADLFISYDPLGCPYP